MTKGGVKLFLLVLFGIYFGAVLFRVDFFPVSWVPMYGHHTPKQKLHVVMGDKAIREAVGFKAVRANGERINITKKDLNIPPANFRRLYQQRAFGRPPPQHARERLQLMPINQWWYETFVGPDPLKTMNYPENLLLSVNATLGYGKDDPRRIVQLEAEERIATFTREQMKAGDVCNPVIQDVVAVIMPGDAVILLADRTPLPEKLYNANFAE